MIAAQSTTASTLENNSQSCRQGGKYCRKPEIKVLIKSVQQRRIYVNCGVFPIAFAASFGFGDRPEEIIYESKIMHQHLRNCLRNKRMRHFPVQNGKTIQRCNRKNQ